MRRCLLQVTLFTTVMMAGCVGPSKEDLAEAQALHERACAAPT